MILVAAISLLAPAMLAGCALVALPLIAHLLNRNARQPVVFPTIRLLRETAAKQSSFFRLRRRVLLLLRSLLVVLLVLAFAEPLWTRSSAADGGGGTAVVIVLDAGASTQRHEGATSIFERLRGEASRVIASLDSGQDVVEIVVADARPYELIGTLSPNRAVVSDALAALRPSDARADLLGSVRLGGQVLERARQARRIVILSDGQATNWLDLLEQRDGGNATLLPAGTSVDVRVPVSAGGTNVAVEARGLSSQHAVPGQTVTARARVSGYESDATITLRCALNGAPIESRVVALRANESRDEVFRIRAPDEGAHHVQISIDDDALHLDNAAYMTLNVGGQQPIGVLSDESPTDPTRGTYFLVRALAPYGDQRDRFAPRSIPSADLRAVSLSGVQTLFVTDIAALTPAAIEVLRTFLEQGGAVVWWCGGGALQENLRALESSMPGLLPFVPGVPSEREGRLVPTALKGQILREFDDVAFVGLGQIRIGRIRTCSLVRDDALTILSFDEGTPALAVRRYGEGAFALVNFSAHPRASDVGRHGAFVAFAQSLATELLVGDGVERLTLVGESLSVACGAEESGSVTDLSLHGPDGDAIAEAVVLEGRTESSVVLDRAPHAGIYEVRRGADCIARAAVNIDPRESDPRLVDGDVIANALATRPAAPRVAESPPVVLSQQGTPLWWIAVLAAVALMGLESLALAVWNQSTARRGKRFS